MEAMMIVLATTLFLAYANGGNDNFKGVATLYGSNLLSYDRALWLATVTTFAGSLASLYVAQSLMVAFSGKGIVPNAIAASPSFVVSVAIGATGTVMLATATGFPVSTTHGLVGAIVGAGLAAIGTDVNFASLGSSFVVPLLVSPVLAGVATMLVYWGVGRVGERLGIGADACVCVEPGQFEAAALQRDGTLGAVLTPPHLVGGTLEACDRVDTMVLGVSLAKVADAVHCVSGGAIGFARGLNDTPKILGILLAAQALDMRLNALLVAGVMAVGGLLNARKVAETIAKRVTAMDNGQALSANIVTAALVILATPLGLPVSTTHVSVGSITGVGIVRGNANWNVLWGILGAWGLTLPIAAAMAFVLYTVCRIVL